MNIMNKVTLKGLRKNRTRTIVTIIGVILSAAMITAVTTFISSLQNYMIEYFIASDGDWHGELINSNLEAYQQLSENDKVKETAITRNGGFAILEGSLNTDKPYLSLLEMDDQAFKLLPVHIISGRLPQNKNEVLVSEHILSNGGVTYQVGDEINLDFGERTLEDGSTLLDNGGLTFTEDEQVAEEFIPKETRKYTVVGICQRLSYELEQYNAAGYTIITTLGKDELKAEDSLNVFVKAKKPGKIYDIIESSVANGGENVAYTYNNELLRVVGKSNQDNFNKVLYSLGAILIALIMVGSISLIYNSFAISVSERKKQFGLLSSAGATARQRRNSVFFEAFVIAAIGIPIGILSGITGIGVTLYLLKDLMSSFMNIGVSLDLTLSVSVPSVIIAALVALVTILLSAYIPARRSRRVSPMDAIRQTSDIKLTAKQVKTSKLTRKIFGMEGTLALKNFKRNRRRYRSTVVSLFISVVLFISASSFAMYLKDGVTNVYENTAYDISMYASNSDYEESEIKEAYQKILGIEGIKQSSLIEFMNGTMELSKDQIQEKFLKGMSALGNDVSGDKLEINLLVYSVDHDTYQSYIKELGFEEKENNELEQGAGIIIDKQHFYNPEEERYNNTSILKDKSLKTLHFTLSSEEDKQIEMDIPIFAFAEITPFGVPEYSYGNSMMLVIDESQKNMGFAAIKDGWNSTEMFFATDDPGKLEKDIYNLTLQTGMTKMDLYNQAESLQASRNIITIISVFAYGFITLISMITIANVFNTISTNVNLRRREFAMLKSVGMTSRGFNKMLNYECIFYGLKALIYGLPVSVGVTYLIYQSIENGVDMAFYVPIQSILISVISVFFVVFISMMYSMQKIRKENILDALKNENL